MSPGGPPLGPASPFPLSLTREPSFTPAGMFTAYFLTWRVWPDPWHVGQGSLISVPVPPHWRHGCEIEKRPCDSASTPRPWQRLQTVGLVPGFAPVPRPVGQGGASGTVTDTCPPSIACSNDTCTSVSRSRPRSGRGVRPAPPPPPNRSDRMSPKPPTPPAGAPPKPPPPPPKPPPGKPPKMPPPESYCLRFSGSDRTAYAPWTSLNRSSASLSPGFLSGWYFRASLR